MLNVFNRRTGRRHRRYTCESEYHLAPICPWRDVPRREIVSASSGNSKARRPPYSTIPMETPVAARMADQSVNEKVAKVSSPFRTPKKISGLSVNAGSGSFVDLNAGDTAHSVCSSWRGRQNRIVRRKGFPRVSTHPATARFRFGTRILAVVGRAANIPVGIAGDQREFAAFALEADIPALLCKGASDALGGQLDSSREIPT